MNERVFNQRLNGQRRQEKVKLLGAVFHLQPRFIVDVFNVEERLDVFPFLAEADQLVGAHGADNLPGGHPSGMTGKLATNGDQTGREVCEVPCSSTWTKIYRPPVGLNPSLGPGSGGPDSDIDYVQWAINIANDDRYYYDHSSSPWTFSCSTFVATALYRTGHLPEDICPPNGDAIGGEGGSRLHRALRKAGFRELKASEVGDFDDLQPGDIFTIGPSYHVAIYIGNGQAVSANGPSPSSSHFNKAASITVYKADKMGYLRTVFRK